MCDYKKYTWESMISYELLRKIKEENLLPNGLALIK